MKKYHLLTVCLTALLLLITLTGVPFLVDRDSTRRAVIGYIEDTYDVELEADSLHWNWLPAPHLTIYGSSLAHAKGLVCTLPQLRLYPDWEKLFLGKIQPRRLDLQRPHFVIKPSLLEKGLTELPSLPVTDIRMTGASLRLDSPLINNIPALSLDLKQGDLELKHLAGRIYLTLEATTSCSDKLSIKGWYNLLTRHYSASVNLANFRLHKLVRISSGFITPLASQVNMQWTCRGALGGDFAGSFRGSLPAFTLHRDGVQGGSFPARTDIRFRQADFDIEKEGETVSLIARDMDLTRPELNLSGTVSRLTGNLDPVYRLDLRARRIELDDVRRSLLNILGDSAVTRQVCDIVRGGRAAEASYRFAGPVADFGDLRNMTIGVDITSSEIQVPGVNLHLEETGGPIVIDNGILTGKGLHTRLGNSRGSNATLAVGLTPEKDLFRLEIDLDADISELPNVLFHLIDEQRFREEIKNFQGRGRAEAHLSMGDRLTDFRTDVDLKDGTNAVISYSRFYWPITFKAGHIHVDRRIEVEDCTLKAGPHHISNISGSCSWRDTPSRLEIREVNADLDAADLLSHFRKYTRIEQIIAPHLQSAKGKIRLSQSRLSGPLSRPAEWEYLLNLRLEDTRITSPHFEGGMNISKARAQLHEDRLTIDSADLLFRQAPLVMEAALNHDSFSDWQGSLTLSGTLNSGFVSWLQKETGLPPSLRPATPCRLEYFKIDRSPDKLDVTGGISREKKNKKVATLDIELHKKDSHLKGLQVRFASPGEKGDFNFQKSAGRDTIILDWQGGLQADTLNALFERPPLNIDRLEGNFKTVVSPITGTIRADGYLKARGLKWYRYLPYTTVTKLDIKGTEQQIEIEKLDLHYNGEEAVISGNVTNADKRPTISLLLSSDFLSRDNVADFAAMVYPYWKKAAGIFSWEGGKMQPESSLKLHCRTFLFSFAGGENGKAKTSILNPLQAEAYSSEQGLVFRLTDSGFCGLNLNGGLLFMDGKFQLREINATSPDSQTVHFENTLPCLGIEGSIIKGSFTTGFSLSQENGMYNDGTVEIHSRNGKILKWGLLAKIFQVVNITELGKFLEGNGFNYDKLTGKGHVNNNILIIDQAELRGHGLDLLARGQIDLQKMTMDITVYLVPFKTIDAILNRIPLIGRLIQGREGHIITVPIGVKGDLADPAVTTLPAKAVGQGAINFIRDTISFPMDIMPGQGGNNEK